MTHHLAGTFLVHKQYQDLNQSRGVNRAVARHYQHTQQTLSAAAKRLDAYFKRLEQAFTNPDPEKAERFLDFYWERLAEALVITPQDIPESHFIHQAQIALEQGFGHVNFTPEQRRQEITMIIQEQRASLQNWFDYLTTRQPGDQVYPPWFRYWAFRGMSSLGHFDKDKGRFTKRDDHTLSPFLELNREALATIYSLLNNSLTPEGKVKVTNAQRQALGEEFLKLLPQAHFAQLYAACLQELDQKNQEKKGASAGEWVKFPEDSDPQILLDSLYAQGTGWCTAGGIETARAHLEGGDFYVYFLYDQHHQPTIPKIAIRTNHGQVAEVRGTDAHQNLSDGTLSQIAQEKYHALPGGGHFDKKTSDMKRLTAIYEQVIDGISVSRADLRFLYEIDEKIEGFGYSRDPRIKTLLGRRDQRQDLSQIFVCTPEQISFTENEALKGNIKYHTDYLNLGKYRTLEGINLPEHLGGDLDLCSLETTAPLRLPQTIKGSLILDTLTDASGIKFPVKVGVHLYLRHLKSPTGTILPSHVGGDVFLNQLESGEGLTFPRTVGGTLSLPHLTSTQGLILPDQVGEGLILRNLQSGKNLKLPSLLGGSLNLENLTDAQGLILPEHLGGDLHLPNLKEAPGLAFPHSIQGGLYLPRLKKIDGITLPRRIGENLVLSDLESAEGLILPEEIGGHVNLCGLKTARNLVFPGILPGQLDLGSLRSAQNVALPRIVEGNLYLSSLKSTQGITLPEQVGGLLALGSLSELDGLQLPSRIGGDLHLDGLIKAPGLVIPENIGGDVDLFNLVDAQNVTFPRVIRGDLNLERLLSSQGLQLPVKVGGTLDLRCLEKADGLVLPEEVGGNLYLHFLESAAGVVFPRAVRQHLYLDGLKTAQELVLPEIIGGALFLDDLRSPEDLNLPRYIGGDLALDNLENIKDLILPKAINGVLYLRSLQTLDRLILPEKAYTLFIPEQFRDDLPELSYPVVYCPRTHEVNHSKQIEERDDFSRER